MAGKKSQINPTNDKNQKPITLKQLQETLWWSWTDIFGWIINDEYLRDLSWQEWIKKFDEMRRSDASVSALLLACSLPIRSTKRSIQPASDDEWVTQDIDWEIADFVHEAIFNNMEITREQFLQECLTFLAFWFSVFEKVYKVEWEKILIKKLAFRHQKTIDYWITQDHMPWITQTLDVPISYGVNAWKSMVSIPWEKLILFTINQEGDNYQWISILRPAYKHWYIKQNLEKFDAIRHQKQGVGVPLIYLPKSATDADKTAALEIVNSFKANEQSWVVMPWPKESWRDFSFANLNASDSTNMLESIKYHMREIVKTVLAQFIELWNTNSWSRSLWDSQHDLFLNAITTFAKIIQNNINRYLIPELVDFNFNTDRYPTIQFGELWAKNLESLANTLSTLITAWAVEVDDELQRVIREQLWLPPMEVEENDKVNDDPIDEVIPKPKADPEKQVDDPIPDDQIEAHEHDGDMWCCLQDQYYMELSSKYNNKLILDIQKKAKESWSFHEVKKKWYKFNDFEDQSPRVMTFAERKVNFTNLKKSMDKYWDQLSKESKKIFTAMKKDILIQVNDAVAANDIAKIWMIKARFTDDFAQTLTNIQKEMFEVWKKSAAAEMWVSVPNTAAETRGVMYVQNQQVVAKIANDMTNTAQSAAMQTIAKRWWSITDTSVTAAKQAINAALDWQIAKVWWAVQSLWISMSLNMWRSNIFEMYPELIYAMQYSAILDGKTTDRCLSLDWRVVKPWSAAFYEYSPPQHYNCRSIRVEILEEEEFKPTIWWIPESIAPALTIDNVPQMSSPVLWKWSPALWIIQEELDDLKSKLDVLKAEWKNEFRQWQYQDRINQLEKALKNK